MFLRHHGILVAGRELGAAIDDLYMLEKAAQLQVLASGLGPLTPIGAETIERTRGQFTPTACRVGPDAWAAMLRMVETPSPTSATNFLPSHRERVHQPPLHGGAGDQRDRGRQVRAARVHPIHRDRLAGNVAVQQGSERIDRGHRVSVNRRDHRGCCHAGCLQRASRVQPDHERARGHAETCGARIVQRPHGDPEVAPFADQDRIGARADRVDDAEGGIDRDRKADGRVLPCFRCGRYRP